MNPFQQLLVPVSFSPKSEEALRRAVELAVRYNARILILHVCPRGAYARCIRRLESLRDRIVGDAKVPVEVLCRTGEPATRIVQVARELPAEVLVMATHSATGDTRWVHGSVGDQVLRCAPCPVIAVCATPRARRKQVAALRTP